MAILQPPLPPPLSHDGIAFVLSSVGGAEVPAQALSDIALALAAALPAGDFDVSPSGLLVYAETEGRSLWRAAGRIESVERGVR